MKNTSCKTIRQEIDNTNLGQEPDSAIKAHLAHCGLCLEFYETQRKLRGLVGSLEVVSAPPDFDFRLRARLANDRIRPVTGLHLGKWAVRLPSAVAAALILVAGVLIMQNRSRPAAPQEKDRDLPVAGSDVNTQQNGSSSTLKVASNPQKAELPLEATPMAPSKIAKSFAPRKSRSRLATEQSAYVAAPVVRRQDSLASGELPLIFPIQSQYQSLRVSLDDGSGVSRTISLPTLTFGSQRVLARTGAAVPTSTKGSW